MYRSIRTTMKSVLPSTVRTSIRNARVAAGIRSTHLHGARTSLGELMDAVHLLSRPRKTVLFYPESPVWISEYVPFKLCALLGYQVINDPRGAYDAAVKFHDSTFSDPARIGAGLPDLDRAINGRSLDISKSTIEATFAEVFGYRLDVDPTRHAGAMVVKSNRNYTHDGQVVEGPLDASEIDEQKVYQKAIDTKTDDGYFVDHRVPIIGDSIPVMYLKYSPPHARFSNETSHIELAAPEEVFASAEIERLLAFARAMNLDYGELDVLRDRGDRRIYVVDVANTPAGPSYGITERQQREALHRMLPPFRKLIDAFSG